jgi:MFS family permease
MAENSVASNVEAPQAAGLRGLLKNRNFKFLWLGQIISDFGDSLTMLTLLILVNALTGSTAAIATMFIVLTIPQITIGLVAGVYVDRLDRKQIMILSDLVRGVLVLGFILVDSADKLWLLYLLGFLQASVGTLFTPARSALIPGIVPRADLMSANSVAQVSRIIFGLLGTAGAGVMVGVFQSFWPAFVLDAVTFFVSVLLVSRIVSPAREAVPDSTGGVKAVFAQLADGMRIIRHSSALAGTLVAAGVLMLGIGAVNVLMVPLIVNDLKVPVTWFAGVEFAQTSAMVLSGSFVAIIAARLKPANIVSVTMLVIGLAVAALSLVTDIWHLIPILFVVGWMVTPLQGSIATLVQTSVSDSLRGRISGALNTVISTSSLVSMGLAGVLATMIGVRSVFVLSGVIIVAAGLASAWVFRKGAKPARTSEDTAPAGMSLSTGVTE